MLPGIENSDANSGDIKGTSIACITLTFAQTGERTAALQRRKGHTLMRSCGSRFGCWAHCQPSCRYNGLARFKH